MFEDAVRYTLCCNRWFYELVLSRDAYESVSQSRIGKVFLTYLVALGMATAVIPH